MIFARLRLAARRLRRRRWPILHLLTSLASLAARAARSMIFARLRLAARRLRRLAQALADTPSADFARFARCARLLRRRWPILQTVALPQRQRTQMLNTRGSACGGGGAP